MRQQNLISPDGSSSSSDDDMGPVLPSAAPKKKKRKVLPYEKLYVAALPTSTRYSKSLMHREQLCFTTFTPFTDFLITSSLDGAVKFWKKSSGDVEFVKDFKAHHGEITSVSVSADGRSFASAGVDNTIKLFDVASFGMWSCAALKTRFGLKLIWNRSSHHPKSRFHPEMYLLGPPQRRLDSPVSSVLARRLVHPYL
jgi:peptidylprolyl isomerase domain and WD repeat-containing protein 1